MPQSRFEPVITPLDESKTSLVLYQIGLLKLLSLHSVNFGSEMVQAKHVSGKNVFWSMNKEKIREERIFEMVNCPCVGRAKLHHLCQPNGPVGWC